MYRAAQDAIVNARRSQEDAVALTALAAKKLVKAEKRREEDRDLKEKRLLEDAMEATEENFFDVQKAAHRI